MIGVERQLTAGVPVTVYVVVVEGDTVTVGPVVGVISVVGDQDHV